MKPLNPKTKIRAVLTIDVDIEIYQENTASNERHRRLAIHAPMTDYPTFAAILKELQPKDLAEAELLGRITQFWEEFGTNTLSAEIVGDIGHITAHAHIENLEGTKVLLVYSGKEGRWRYSGAHIESDPFSTAVEEAERALGHSLEIPQPKLHRIREQRIDEYWNTPAHIHFEITYRFVADEENELPRGARWVELEEAERLLAVGLNTMATQNAT
ncbi:MAG: hypothetical protein EOP04_24355 [Proteobacteria bacterium]|nr:MAG: hypothetical protein EOP04_24355 [Pseudomonadota bacterium]